MVNKICCAKLDHSCHSWVQAEVVLEMMSLLTTTLIITFRIHAILGNMRGLLPVLLSLWGAQAIVSAVLVIMLVNIKAGRTLILKVYVFMLTIPTTATITVQPIFNVCFAILDRVYTIWIPSMFFHTRRFPRLKLADINLTRFSCVRSLGVESAFDASRCTNPPPHAPTEGRYGILWRCVPCYVVQPHSLGRCPSESRSSFLSNCD